MTTWLKLSTAALACTFLTICSHTPYGQATTDKTSAKDSKGTTDTAAGQQQVNPNMVVGKVDNQTIRMVDVMERIRVLPPQLQQAPIDQLFPNVLRQMAARLAITKKAREKGLDKSAEFKKMQKEVELNMLQEMYLFADMKQNFTDEELKKEYDAYRKTFVVEDQVQVRHILVKEEAEAKEILEKLKKGEDFAKLAEKSLDHGTAKNGGDLGFFGKNDLIPEFTKIAFDLKDGEMTQATVKTPFGYHIIKREASRKTEALSYEKAKSGLIPGRLRQKQLQERYKEATASLKIELFNIDGSALPMLDPMGPGEMAPAGASLPPESHEADKSAAHVAPAASPSPVQEAIAAGQEAGKALKK